MKIHTSENLIKRQPGFGSSPPRFTPAYSEIDKSPAKEGDRVKLKTNDGGIDIEIKMVSSEEYVGEIKGFDDESDEFHGMKEGDQIKFQECYIHN